MFQFSSRSKKRMEGVDERLVKVAEEALKLTKVDFGIPEYGGWRSPEQQHKLYLDGKSKADGLYKKSYHQSGMALDVYAYVEGKASWDEGHLAQVACAMFQAAMNLGYKIEWGGLWKNFLDMPHFQLMEEA